MSTPYGHGLKLLVLAATLLLALTVIKSNLYFQHVAAKRFTAAAALKPQGSESLLQQATQQPTKSREAIAQAALLGNPTDARPLILMAQDAALKGQQRRAIALIQAADQLGPRMPDNQMLIAEFWEKQGNPNLALRHLSVALEMKPSYRTESFPELFKLAQDQKTRGLIKTLMDRPPAWWPDFFNYALTQKMNPELLDFLFSAHNKLLPEVAKNQTRAYVERLINERNWVKAYFAWINSLDQERLGALGYLYNGSFELAPTGYGFDWRVNPDARYHVNLEQTDLKGAASAIAISFTGTKPISNQLITQWLLIEAGRYHLAGQFKSEQLIGGEGLSWVIRCADGRPIARTPQLLGTHPWSQFDVDFDVPTQGCQAQMMTLEIDPGSFNRLDYSGRIWFDQFSLIRAAH
jgi:hypothetical protein